MASVAHPASSEARIFCSGIVRWAPLNLHLSYIISFLKKGFVLS
jgi:hypothetical protein